MRDHIKIVALACAVAALAWYATDIYYAEREARFERAWDIGYGAGKQAAIDSVEADSFRNSEGQ